MSKQFSTFVFDFDGTLVNTFVFIKKILPSICQEFGQETFTDQQIETMREKGFGQLIKELKIPLWQVPKLNGLVQQELAKYLDQIEFFPDIVEQLQHLKSQTISLGILSSNSRDNIRQFLARQDQGNLFDFVYTGKNIFGKDKVLKKMLNIHQLDPLQILYFGDEVRDIQACRKVNIKVAAVSWGFNTKNSLAAHQPDYLLDQVTQISQLLK